MVGMIRSDILVPKPLAAVRKSGSVLGFVKFLSMTPRCHSSYVATVC